MKFTSNLRAAIERHLSGERDEDERSPLHILVSEIAAQNGLRARVSAQLVALLQNGDAHSDEWWQLVEWVVIEGSLRDPQLVGALEAIAVGNVHSSPASRSHILRILSALGRGLPPTDLLRDTELRDSYYGRWMDLVWGGIAERGRLQQLVVDGIRTGKLTVGDLEYRLDRIREAGGADLGRFLSNIAKATPTGRRKDIVALLNDAFGTGLQPAGEQAEVVMIDRPRPTAVPGNLIDPRELKNLAAVFVQTKRASIFAVQQAA
jgi:hypothetical protein